MHSTCGGSIFGVIVWYLSILLVVELLLGCLCGIYVFYFWWDYCWGDCVVYMYSICGGTIVGVIVWYICILYVVGLSLMAMWD